MTLTAAAKTAATKKAKKAAAAKEAIKVEESKAIETEKNQEIERKRILKEQKDSENEQLKAAVSAKKLEVIKRKAEESDAAVASKKKKVIDGRQDAIMFEYEVTEDHPLFNLNKKRSRITRERIYELNKDLNKEDVSCKILFIFNK